MSKKNYFMESRNESFRLDLKTEFSEIEKPVLWAGLKPGMRVLDVGCGIGKTTYFLKHIAGKDSHVVGIDLSEERLLYAREHYKGAGIEFERRDIYSQLDDLGRFDFIWVRFFLEYYKQKSFELVKTLTELLTDFGILCLGDLDHNGLNHFDIPDRCMRAIYGCARALEESADFDPYAGRKLYSYLYDLGFREIDVRLDAHHLIFGELDSVDAYNWFTKLSVAGKNSGYSFDEYPGGFEEFFKECKDFFYNPRRFTYTPLITCRGVKPTGL